MIVNSESLKQLTADQLTTLRRLVDAEQRRRGRSKPPRTAPAGESVAERAHAVSDEITGEGKRREARERAAEIEREMRGRA